MPATQLDRFEGDTLGRRTKMDPEERRARNRAYHGYIRNALEPTSAAIYDDITVAELKRMARDWADQSWQDYLD